MSEAIQVRNGSVATAWPHEQKELIRRTVAPQASDDELSMFLHIAARSGLDPLLKQIHLLKVGGRCSIVADINGLQARAAREPDYEGIDHAVVYEKDEFLVDNTTGEVLKHLSNPFANGFPVGAWAVVHRKGMRPFRSMVRFAEYLNPNNPLWKSKPSVMIDKCAKSTALRLAYPEQLGGVYEEAELGKEERPETEVNPPPVSGKRTADLKAQLAARIVRAPEPPKDEAPEEPPPPTDADAPASDFDQAVEAFDTTTGEVAAKVRRHHDITYPFGRDKGKPLSKASNDSLQFWKEKLQKDIATGDPKWTHKREEELEAVNGEIEYRTP